MKKRSDLDSSLKGGRTFLKRGECWLCDGKFEGSSYKANLLDMIAVGRLRRLRVYSLVTCAAMK